MSENLDQAIIRMAMSVKKDPPSVGVLSTGEACAVALVLGDMALAPKGYTHPLDALERLGAEWETAVRRIHRLNLLDTF